MLRLLLLQCPAAANALLLIVYDRYRLLDVYSSPPLDGFVWRQPALFLCSKLFIADSAVLFQKLPAYVQPLRPSASKPLRPVVLPFDILCLLSETFHLALSR